MTEIIKIDDLNQVDTGVENKIVETLKTGGIILYPTDTLYGLGARISNKDAVNKVRKIKERDSQKPISILVSNKDMLGRYVETNEVANQLIGNYLPGALTLILTSKDKDLSNLLGSDEKLGVRIPDVPFILKIVEKLDCPITTTSANISGKENLNNVTGILEQLRENKDLIDLVIDAGEVTGQNSTIVDVADEKPNVIRQGILKIN
ncbi:threonylcarbamoyl-AMP synthase [Candidatus Nomurabacteria bacterium]|nr:threonylcarbamoyl-AMP synthase [Candidatus Nomurabacteria bacterium]